MDGKRGACVIQMESLALQMGKGLAWTLMQSGARRLEEAARILHTVPFCLTVVLLCGCISNSFFIPPSQITLCEA